MLYIYLVHLSIATLGKLTLHLEDRNDISDKVQKLNLDCSLMELIYGFVFFFAFVYVIQENLNPVHMFCAYIPKGEMCSLFICGYSEFLRIGEGK